VGEAAANDRPLCQLHARDEAGWQRAARNLRAAVRIGDRAPAPSPVVRERLARMAAR
jgi:thymidine phosphorylase